MTRKEIREQIHKDQAATKAYLKAQHTPTPWKEPQYIGENTYWIATPSGNKYSDHQECGLKVKPWGNRSINQDKADAAFIVRAVNSHEALKTQLQSLYDLVCNIQSNVEGANIVMREAENVGCNLEAVREAIAQAEGE